jgi:hypothetical protein
MSEQLLPPSWDGSVVLDIGGDVGALMLRVSADLDGHEIDIQPDDARLPRTHSAVRERRLASGSVYAAIYPRLTQGSYTVVTSGQRFHVTGGRITELDFEAT